MALSQVRIKSFKSIVDQTIDLGQLNVFIGTNGAGKSNLLEAIGVLSCAVDGRVDYSKLADRGIRLSAPEVFKSSFKNITRSNTFSLDATFGDLSYHANINANKEAEFNFSAESISNTNGKLGSRSNAGVTITSLGKKIKLPPQQSVVGTLEVLGNFSDDELIELKALKQYSIYALSTPILRGVSQDTSNKEPLGLYGGSLASALAEVINEFAKVQGYNDLQRFFKLLDWFKLIGTTDDISAELQSNHLHTGKNVVRFVDKYMGLKFNKLYAYDVSEGALYILFILVLLLHKKAPPLFALDNVDSALNPGMVREMMEHIIELLKGMPEKQILMTTHNPTTLDAVDLFNPSHRLFVVQRNLQGHTEINRIEPPPGFTRESWVEKYQGMRLSEIWLSGLIGGLTKGF
ncbi:MAG: AAA family ATPase [Methylobacter sp.]|uniref:AAA family ATPase n=1 Tax=Methylobacter sp. TaxID=2051955 RepID=UPI002487D829|nr:ATP-binding protein [Methylobacter sp.]MDI1358379.1 AAA family ATPase [Methylobacter sp.]